MTRHRYQLKEEAPTPSTISLLELKLQKVIESRKADRQSMDENEHGEGLCQPSKSFDRAASSRPSLLDGFLKRSSQRSSSSCAKALSENEHFDSKLDVMVETAEGNEVSSLGDTHTVAWSEEQGSSRGGLLKTISKRRIRGSEEDASFTSPTLSWSGGSSRGHSSTIDEESESNPGFISMVGQMAKNRRNAKQTALEADLMTQMASLVATHKVEVGELQIKLNQKDAAIKTLEKALSLRAECVEELRVELEDTKEQLKRALNVDTEKTISSRSVMTNDRRSSRTNIRINDRPERKSFVLARSKSLDRYSWNDSDDECDQNVAHSRSMEIDNCHSTLRSSLRTSQQQSHSSKAVPSTCEKNLVEPPSASHHQEASKNRRVKLPGDKVVDDASVVCPPTRRSSDTVLPKRTMNKTSSMRSIRSSECSETAQFSTNTRRKNEPNIHARQSSKICRSSDDLPPKSNRELFVRQSKREGQGSNPIPKRSSFSQRNIVMDAHARLHGKVEHNDKSEGDRIVDADRSHNRITHVQKDKSSHTGLLEICGTHVSSKRHEEPAPETPSIVNKPFSLPIAAGDEPKRSHPPTLSKSASNLYLMRNQLYIDLDDEFSK